MIIKKITLIKCLVMVGIVISSFSALRADAGNASFSGTCVASSYGIDVYKNGSPVETVSCGSGSFQTSVFSVSSGDKITLHQYLGGAGIVKSNGTAASNLDLTHQNALILYTQGSMSLTNTDMLIAGSGILDEYYVGASPDIAMVGNKLYIAGNTSFTGNLQMFPGDSAIVVLPGANFNITGSVYTSSLRALNGGVNVGNTIFLNSPDAMMFELIFGGSATVKNVTIQNTKNYDFNIPVRLTGVITVTGNLRIDGQSTNRRLLLNDTTYPLADIIFIGGSQFISAGYLTVKGTPLSTITDNSANVTLPLLGTPGQHPYYSINQVPGSTSGWFNVLIQGRAYSDNGATPLPAGKAIYLVRNGTNVTGPVYTTNTPDQGTFTFGVLGNPTDMIAVYTGDSSVPSAVTVTRLGGPDITNLDLYGDNLIIRDDDNNPSTVITNANLDTAHGGSPYMSELYFNGGGTTLTTTAVPNGYPLRTLRISPGTVFTPGGNTTLGGNLFVQGTFNAGSFVHSLDGYFSVPTSGYYNATGGAAELMFQNSNLQTYSNTSSTSSIINTKVTVNKTLDGASPGRVELLSALNNNNQTFNIANNNSLFATKCFSTIVGTLNNNGYLEVCGNETLPNNSDTDSGTWIYKGNPNATIKDFGTPDYYNLIINTTNTTGQVNLLSPLVTANDLRTFKGRFNTNNNTIDINGSFAVGDPDSNNYSGEFNAGSSTINVFKDWVVWVVSKFLYGTSHVILDGGTQQIGANTPLTSSNQIFYKLSKIYGGIPGVLRLVSPTSVFIYGPTGLNLSGTAAVPLTLNNIINGQTGKFLMMPGSTFGAIQNISVRDNQLMSSPDGINFFTLSPELTTYSGYTNPGANIIDTAPGSTLGWFNVPPPPEGDVENITLSANPNVVDSPGDTPVDLTMVFSAATGNTVSDTCTITANPASAIPDLPVEYTFDSESNPVTEYLTVSVQSAPVTVTATCAESPTTSASVIISPVNPPVVKGIPVFKNN